MVSDAVGTKVLGESGEGTLSTVSPLRGMENETENSFTNRWIPMSSVWRARNRGTPRDLQADLQRTDVGFNSTV